MTQTAKTTFWEEISDWNCECGEFVPSWIFAPRDLLWKWSLIACGREGLRHGSRDVEQAFVGKGLAPFGPVGQRAFAHSIHALERSREVWAAL